MSLKSLNNDSYAWKNNLEIIKLYSVIIYVIMETRCSPVLPIKHYRHCAKGLQHFRPTKEWENK
jgi:uncharacterized membrane protein